MGDLLTISQLVGIGKCLQHLFGSGTENPRVGAERGPVDSAPGHHFSIIFNNLQDAAWGSILAHFERTRAIATITATLISNLHKWYGVKRGKRCCKTHQ